MTSSAKKRSKTARSLRPAASRKSLSREVSCRAVGDSFGVCAAAPRAIVSKARATGTRRMVERRLRYFIKLQTYAALKGLTLFLAATHGLRRGLEFCRASVHFLRVRGV